MYVDSREYLKWKINHNEKAFGRAHVGVIKKEKNARRTPLEALVIVLFFRHFYIL